LVTIKNYVRVNSLEEAYQLNQKRSNVVLGGMLWLKMGKRNIQNAIDLSGLQLDQIEETEEQFNIGAMCSLRQLETSRPLNDYYGGIIGESLRHIVGVQFRNCATIGGSIFGRFGFSDILTCLLVLDTSVQLYKGGEILLSEFISIPRDNDILVRIIIRKTRRPAVYQSFRMTRTDFPILACSASLDADKLRVAMGARPMKAELIETDRSDLDFKTEQEQREFAAYLAKKVRYGSNMRGSAGYREHLAAVSVWRALKVLGGEVSW